MPVVEWRFGEVHVNLRILIPARLWTVITRPDSHSKFAASLFCILIVVTVSGLSAQAVPPRDGLRTPAGAPLGAVTGSIVAADSGRPLRDARVSLSPAEGQGIRYTVTDDSGRYEFKDVAAGRYVVSATKPGYLNLSYGQKRAFESGTRIAVNGGVVGRIDLALPKGGVIAGVVIDEFGDPVVGATVTPERERWAGGLLRLEPVSTGMVTNDLGEFRVYGLQPGTYYVTARKRSSIPGLSVGQTDYVYTEAYSPSGMDPSHARRVRVELGVTVPDVSITIARVKTAAIAGYAMDGYGQPLAGTAVVIRREGRLSGPTNYGRAVQYSPALMTTGSPVGADGSFLITGVAPGSYELRAINVRGDNPRAAVAHVTVNGENINGIQLVPLELPAIRGRLRVDPSASAALPSGIKLTAVTAGYTEDWGVSKPFTTAEALPVGAMLPFSVTTQPAQVLIDAALPAGWTIKSVMRDGVDLSDGGVDARDPRSLEGIEVEVTNRLTTVRGTVRDVDGTAARSDYTVVVFARDKENRLWTSRRFAVTRPDQAGQFVVSGLAPGEYYVSALDYLDPAMVEDGDLLDSLVELSKAVTIGEGQALEIVLPVRQ